MQFCWLGVLSVTILETTKTDIQEHFYDQLFYRSQFWRLQKLVGNINENGNCFIGHNFGDYKNQGAAGTFLPSSFIGHNFGDYKNWLEISMKMVIVLSVTILETTKTLLSFFYLP